MNTMDNPIVKEPGPESGMQGEEEPSHTAAVQEATLKDPHAHEKEKEISTERRTGRPPSPTAAADTSLPSRAALLCEVARLQTQLENAGAWHSNGPSTSTIQMTPDQLREFHRRRVLAEVVGKEVRAFLSASRGITVCSKCLTAERVAKGTEDAQETDTSGAGEARSPPHKRGRGEEGEMEEPIRMGPAVSLCLENLREEKHRLERQLERLEGETLQPLRAKVEELVQEKAIAVEEAERLREELSSAGAANAPSSLLQEVRQLRVSEALLRQQLAEAETKAMAAADGLTQAMEDGVAASTQTLLPLQQRQQDLLQRVAALEAEKTAALLLAEEAERRGSTILEAAFHFTSACSTQPSAQLHLSPSPAEGRAAPVLHTCLAQYYAEALQGWETRFEAAKATANALQEQNEKLQTELEEMRRAAVESGNRSTDGAGKRPRPLEDDDSSAGSGASLRRRYLEFWYKGREKITQLESQVQKLEGTAGQLRVAEGRVAQLERHRCFMGQQLAAVASTVEQLREQERTLRTELAGIRVEKDCLVDTVAQVMEMERGRGGAPSGLLDRKELEACGETIRRAAAEAAAASAAVVVDPQVIARAERHAQETKTEVERLEKLKEKLLRFVDTTEQRVRALLEQEVLLQQRAARSGGPRPPPVSSNGQQGESDTGLVELGHLLQHIRACAKDIFDDCHRSVLGSGPASSRATEADHASDDDPGLPTSSSSYLDLQQRLDRVMQEKATTEASLQRQLQIHQQQAMALQRAEISRATAAGQAEDMITALQGTNQTLTAQVTQLRHELAALSEERDNLRRFAQCAVHGIRYTCELLRSGMKTASELRGVVAVEREDLRRVLVGQRPGSEEGGGAGTVVVEALQRLSSAIQDRAALLEVRAGAECTEFLGDVVKALKAQEDRLDALQKKNEDDVAGFANRLPDHLLSATETWNTLWQEKFHAAELEHRHVALREKSQTALYQYLETIRAPSKCTPGFAVVEDWKTEDSPQHLVGEAVRAIEGYLQQLSPPISHGPSATVTAPVVSPSAASGDGAPAAPPQGNAPTDLPATSHLQSAPVFPPVSTAEGAPQETDNREEAVPGIAVPANPETLTVPPVHVPPPSSTGQAGTAGEASTVSDSAAAPEEL